MTVSPYIDFVSELHDLLVLIHVESIPGSATDPHHNVDRVAPQAALEYQVDYKYCKQEVRMKEIIDRCERNREKTIYPVYACMASNIGCKLFDRSRGMMYTKP